MALDGAYSKKIDDSTSVKWCEIGAMVVIQIDELVESSSPPPHCTAREMVIVGNLVCVSMYEGVLKDGTGKGERDCLRNVEELGRTLISAVFEPVLCARVWALSSWVSELTASIVMSQGWL